VAGESEEGINKTEDKTKKMPKQNMEKLRNYLGLGLAHKFLIIRNHVSFSLQLATSESST